MVGLNPAKFYGRLLPRPRIYCDVKFSDARVDPPESVNAALLEWAGDAHWKMGGTSMKRKRMSGKIEGRMSKLRAMEESDEEPSPRNPARGQQGLSFGKSKVSQAADVQKSMTPIERMLASPSPKRVHSSPPSRRISGEFFVPSKKRQQEADLKSKTRRKASRKEPVIEDSDNDSDDGLESFMEKLEASKDDPNRSMRRSARLQGSPHTPDVKKRSSRKSSPPSGRDLSVTPSPYRSPSQKRALDSVSDSDSDSDISESQSQFY